MAKNVSHTHTHLSLLLVQDPKLQLTFDFLSPIH